MKTTDYERESAAWELTLRKLRAEAEKAEVELATARLVQEHIRNAKSLQELAPLAGYGKTRQ